MRFTNAYSGVSKIRTAQILSVIVTAVMVLASVLSLGLLSADTDSPTGSTYLMVSGVAILGLTSVVLSIIALILNISGISKASRDEPSFKAALVAVIVNIVVAIISASIQDNTRLSDALSLVSSVAQALTAIFVIRGVTGLADQLGDGEMVEYGRSTRIVILILCAVSIVLRIVGSMFVYGSSATVVSSGLTLSSSFVSLGQFIVYLLYLNRARQLLV